MQDSAWRYHPEFIIRILINGQDAGDAVRLMPSSVTAATFRNYGLLTRHSPGALLGFVRQHHDGTNFVPAAPIVEPILFSFRLIARQGADFPSLDFFDQGDQLFGRQVLYANNLSAAGAIDSNLAAGVVSLTAGAVAGNPERGSLSTYLLSVEVAPGDFTLLEAGKIEAGAPVSFSISQPVAPTQSNVAFDFTLLPKGAYVVRMQGATPVEERVVFDQDASRADVNGIIDIYKDAWQIAPQPREYRIDFSST